ncbi:hypothetical protein DK37_23885 [Halomonas sp. SUBG004]|nr:hypothetical protein DK37_23885 [Halomonas sp. SUBG004]
MRYHMLEALCVADPVTLEPVAKDGRTMGEILMRGNNVMKGYLKRRGNGKSPGGRLVPHGRLGGMACRWLYRDQRPLERYHHLRR